VIEQVEDIISISMILLCCPCLCEHITRFTAEEKLFSDAGKFIPPFK